MIPYAAYRQIQEKKARDYNVCSCACHPCPFPDRPKREQHSIYCSECNEERFTPWTRLIGLDA